MDRAGYCRERISLAKHRKKPIVWCSGCDKFMPLSEMKRISIGDNLTDIDFHCPHCGTDFTYFMWVTPGKVNFQFDTECIAYTYGELREAWLNDPEWGARYGDDFDTWFDDLVLTGYDAFIITPTDIDKALN